MAQESCNLDNEEAEILKSSSPSNPSPSQSTAAAISNPLSSAAAASGAAAAAAPASLCLKRPQEFSVQKAERPEASTEASCTLKAKKESRPSVQLSNRCTSCKRKVGLTGFRCRCGDLFCFRHRYSETHDCSFDYKALGREEISKANPLIRAAKIIKI